jgi:hypothetical protein
MATLLMLVAVATLSLAALLGLRAWRSHHFRRLLRRRLYSWHMRRAGDRRRQLSVS